jgi:hypothetical protein
MGSLTPPTRALLESMIWSALLGALAAVLHTGLPNLSSLNPAATLAAALVSGSVQIEVYLGFSFLALVATREAGMLTNGPAPGMPHAVHRIFWYLGLFGIHAWMSFVLANSLLRALATAVDSSSWSSIFTALLLAGKDAVASQLVAILQSGAVVYCIGSVSQYMSVDLPAIASLPVAAGSATPIAAGVGTGEPRTRGQAVADASSWSALLGAVVAALFAGETISLFANASITGLAAAAISFSAWYLASSVVTRFTAPLASLGSASTAVHNTFWYTSSILLSAWTAYQWALTALEGGSGALLETWSAYTSSSSSPLPMSDLFAAIGASFTSALVAAILAHSSAGGALYLLGCLAQCSAANMPAILTRAPEEVAEVNVGKGNDVVVGAGGASTRSEPLASSSLSSARRRARPADASH